MKPFERQYQTTPGAVIHELTPAVGQVLHQAKQAQGDRRRLLLRHVQVLVVRAQERERKAKA